MILLMAFPLWLTVAPRSICRQKGGDLTQSYDKSPYTHEMGYLQILKCVLFIKQLLRLVGRLWSHKPI